LHQQWIIVKKPNVFRLKLQDGNEYLFYAKDDIEMNDWINLIHNCIASSLSSIITSTTIPIPTIKEGFLSRKHEWEGHERKATHRAWEKFYCALTSNRLSFYKDAKHLKTGRTVSDDLNFDSSTNVSQATDYRKKQNVFRLKLHGGNEYLFHAKDDLEMNEWITSINNLISSLSTIVTSTTQIPSVALTSPPTVLTSSPRQSQQQQQQQQLPTMTTSSSGVEMSQPSASTEPKSRTLPSQSSTTVEPSSTQSASTSGKKKSGGFFSIKKK
jgi:hypothetical protein